MKKTKRWHVHLIHLFIIFLFLILLIPTPALSADVVDSDYVGYTNRATSINNISVCTPEGNPTYGFPPNTILFENIEEYGENIDQVHAYYDYSEINTHSSVDADNNLTVRLRGGVDSTSNPLAYPVVGNGSCYYSKSDDTSMYYLTLMIDDLDGLGSPSGDYLFYIDGMNFHGLGVKWYNGVNWESPDTNWVNWGGWKSGDHTRPAYAGAETRIVSLKSFQNVYYAYDDYTLNINKTVAGTPYYSAITIVDGNVGEILNESSYNTNDVWIYISDPANGTTVYFEDTLADTYTASPSFTPSPPPDDGVLNTLSGVVKDAKTNAIIPLNPINLSTVTGYGGSYNTTSNGDGTYSISRIINDIYTISANRTGYENYTFQKNITSDTLHNIYMVQNITLTANKSGVYGTVTNYYNATGVTDVWVQISNETWSQVTYTNVNGYYEFLNFTPGNYTIQATKNGYFPYEILITFSVDELKYHPFDLVSEDVPASPTATPSPPTTNILTPFRSLIQQFGISAEFGGALIALFIIVFAGAIFSKAGPMAIIAAMFFGFVVTVFMGLLPSYLLSIVIIVVVLLILRLRGDF